MDAELMRDLQSVIDNHAAHFEIAVDDVIFAGGTQPNPDGCTTAEVLAVEAARRENRPPQKGDRRAIIVSRGRQPVAFFPFDERPAPFWKPSKTQAAAMALLFRDMMAKAASGPAVSSKFLQPVLAMLEETLAGGWPEAGRLKRAIERVKAVIQSGCEAGGDCPDDAPVSDAERFLEVCQEAVAEEYEDAVWKPSVKDGCVKMAWDPMTGSLMELAPNPAEVVNVWLSPASSAIGRFPLYVPYRT